MKWFGMVWGVLMACATADTLRCQPLPVVPMQTLALGQKIEMDLTQQFLWTMAGTAAVGQPIRPFVSPYDSHTNAEFTTPLQYTDAAGRAAFHLTVTGIQQGTWRYGIGYYTLQSTGPSTETDVFICSAPLDVRVN